MIELEKVLANAKRWAKSPVLNEPLFRYWMKYNESVSISLPEFRQLALYGAASNQNVVALHNSRTVQPKVNLKEFFSLHIEKSRRVPLHSGNGKTNEQIRKNSK